MDSPIICFYALWGSLQHQKHFSREEAPPPCQVGLTYGWKNRKQPSGPIELDLEASNLVAFNLIDMLEKADRFKFLQNQENF